MKQPIYIDYINSFTLYS